MTFPYFFRVFIPMYVGGLVVLLTIMIPLTCRAETEKEIHHLLQFIENSECVFVRNNNRNSSLKARKHIERKYNYIKRRVKTAEDFIKYAATQSIISGKPYMIICKNREDPFAEWLQTELDAFRKKRLDAIK